MSRGLGHIERQILEQLEEAKQFGGCIFTESRAITAGAFGHNDPTRAQRLSVVRAMHSFVWKFPRYALCGGQGQRVLFLYDKTDPKTVAWVQDSGF
jgi:hypothetical protein